jgi:hypothetical protein
LLTRRYRFPCAVVTCRVFRDYIRDVSRLVFFEAISHCPLIRKLHLFFQCVSHKGLAGTVE